ncbi:MAG: carbohydrate kinase family protein [Chloroflexus sp.]|uniref:carbohydrate kinase family protein n=1 Tax=Chloroflexus sp. TaxID=1904827 RepID=UPI00404B0EF5
MTPDTPFDLLVAGEINPDLILSGDVEPAFGQVEKLVESAALTIGSSSVIFACGAARLGLKVAFIGKCGDDVFGRFMLEEMQKRNVNVENVIQVPGGSTGLSVILNRGVDRAILTHPGLIPALAAEDIPDGLLRQARHLHVASYFLQDALRPGLPRLFERARSLGLTTSLDTNYDPSETWSGVFDLLPLTNVFLPNEAEVCSLTGEKTADLAADRLAGRVETLAIKLGAQGALGVSKGQKVRASSIPVKVIDTVGAGDSFDAGFLYGYLNGWPLEKSLRMAAVCGALSTQAAGGTAAQPTLDQARAYLKPDT